jgi:hypothetical protein
VEEEQCVVVDEAGEADGLRDLQLGGAVEEVVALQRPQRAAQRQLPPGPHRLGEAGPCLE